MDNFKPVPIIINFLQIAKINKEGIYELEKLMENLVYQAPEILTHRFWQGTGNWRGITNIMNTYFPRISDTNRHLFTPEQIEENKKMEELYVNLLKRYQIQGFDK
jgi:hypothetical protein